MRIKNFCSTKSSVKEDEKTSHKLKKKYLQIADKELITRLHKELLKFK